MPKKVYNNVVDHRLLDGDNIIEDVTSVELPELNNKSTEFDVAGMAAALNAADPTSYEAMMFKVSHNNGHNCHLLSTPGKHMFEFRLARQVLNTATGDLGYSPTKYRISCLKQKESGGTIERGNPQSGSVEYGITRYEAEVDGVVVTLIDVLAGIVRVNGVDYTNQVRSMLD